MTKVNHLQSLCVIHVDFDIWSGQTRLSASDLKLGEGGEIPPEKVAQLGSKKICDPAKLKGFHRLKTETRRLLLKFGMPFMNGFAVPVSKTDEICNKLNDISIQFNQLKQDFINGYNKAVDEWCLENPEYEGAIRAGALPKETVEERIGFEYQVFMIQPVSEDEANAKRLNRKVERLGDDLISELVQEANKFYMERLAGRDQCAVTTRQTLRNIRDKVDGLSFLNSAFNPLVKLLDQTLRGYERHADGRNIVAPFFYQVVAAVLIMSERNRIEQYVNGSITVESMANDVGGSEAQMGDRSKDEKAEQKSDKSGEPTLASEEGEANQQQVGGTESVQSEQTNGSGNAVDLDEDIDNFFKNFTECSEDESEDKSNAGDAIQEEHVDVEDEPVLPEETPVEQESIQEENPDQEPPKTDDDGDYFF
ncbi:DUF3150 domain-containing protein [Escherichia coli]|uniref:DUF3150 domain-containing protein n=1 Tax=Escherichia coli TaxID=562 RepID=UPI00186BA7EE|nr:DUF3150 domain-containing protein [Escherichia coli]MBE4622639.1 DUF3150 domain-containing protein [Escherichia coli]MCV8132181.1 DUF3150 domain-containing protein [Escherichia coli]MDF8452170.1 DUF3150 domain-containing protein [Escherichia coli]MDF8735158.1 DUF3150 domain-containing protein [Escherichia coli]MDF8852990.1 DUF3150 domain-containing protein [Escherichia coli]